MRLCLSSPFQCDVVSDLLSLKHGVLVLDRCNLCRETEDPANYKGTAPFQVENCARMCALSGAPARTLTREWTPRKIDMVLWVGGR